MCLHGINQCVQISQSFVPLGQVSLIKPKFLNDTEFTHPKLLGGILNVAYLGAMTEDEKVE